jgi:hypothetical protein
MRITMTVGSACPAAIVLVAALVARLSGSAVALESAVPDRLNAARLLSAPCRTSCSRTIHLGLEMYSTYGLRVL